MTYIIAIFLTLIFYVASKFFAGFWGVDSAQIITGAAIFLAIRSDLRIDDLEKERRDE